jgi:hypothetical protein
MCRMGKLLVHHPPSVATDLGVGVIRHIQILVRVGVITVSIEHWIPPITILGVAILWRVDGVCCLIHNHQSVYRRIDIWIVNRTVKLEPLHRRDWTLVISLGVHSRVQKHWSDGLLGIRRQRQGREGRCILYLRGIVRRGVLQSRLFYTLKTTTTSTPRGCHCRMLSPCLSNDLRRPTVARIKTCTPHIGKLESSMVKGGVVPGATCPIWSPLLDLWGGDLI